MWAQRAEQEGQGDTQEALPQHGPCFSLTTKQSVCGSQGNEAHTLGLDAALAR